MWSITPHYSYFPLFYAFYAIFLSLFIAFIHSSHFNQSNLVATQFIAKLGLLNFDQPIRNQTFVPELSRSRK